MSDPARPHFDPDALRHMMMSKLAEAVGLTPDAISALDLTLGGLLSASSRLHNSVDLMEALAKAVNVVRRELGVKLRLRAFTMDTPIPRVIDSFVEQVRSLLEAE
jgi:hypothetical protein